MDNPSSTIEFAEPHVAAFGLQKLFILPPLRPRRVDDLTILILTDGNRRASSNGGYAGGARRVVSIAEHLARRPDVAAMVACILSPDNISKRSDGFFFDLYKEFIELGIAIETRGALIDAQIRMELWGDLGSLRARGGHAVALVDAMEAVARRTARVAEPNLRLILGVGYGPDTARELDVDVILRTGMEEPGVLRLSGLRTGEGIVTCAITTLWPEVESRDIDEVIALCKRRASPRFDVGHSLAMIVDFIEALSKTDLVAPIQVTIPTSAQAAAVTSALDHLYAGPLHECTAIAVEYAGDDDATPIRHGPRRRVQLEILVVSGSPWGRASCNGELSAVLAPGQEPPSFTLPGWLPLGSANVHVCAATAEGMVRGIRETQRFAAAHPPLLGGDRRTGQAAAPRAPKIVESRGGAADRDELGDRFVGKTLQWAASAGLVLPNAAWRKAAASYALTAFFIHFRIPTEWDDTGVLWEERADLTAKYMLLVGAGDEGIFDQVFDGETPKERWTRLEACSRFLRTALASEGARPRLPRVPGSELLAVIAAEWRALFDRYQNSCLPTAAASFRAGLEDLYSASLAEHRPGLASDLRTLLGEDPAVAAVIEKRLKAAPSLMASRARSLVASAMAGNVLARNELFVLLYLTEVASGIGAGLLFRTSALTAPASMVTDRSIRLLEEAAMLLDYHVRLANDMSGFLDAPNGDRDPKENACTLLVPGSASPEARTIGTIQALATCRRLAAWVGEEVGNHIEHVAAAWPSMGTILRRGAFVGRRVYEVAHYTTISRAGMSAIFDEADEALAGNRGRNFDARTHGGITGESDDVSARPSGALVAPPVFEERGRTPNNDHGPPSGHETTPSLRHIQVAPEVIQAADEALDELDAILGDRAPTSCSAPDPMSRFAVRDDGALLVSIEDATDRDLSGRELITFMVLRTSEVRHARAVVDSALAYAVAQTVARLPRRAT